eukprot:scaffold107171_cov99-Phaeocystis_antarctica.AAC.1
MLIPNCRRVDGMINSQGVELNPWYMLFSRTDLGTTVLPEKHRPRYRNVFGGVLNSFSSAKQGSIASGRGASWCKLSYLITRVRARVDRCEEQAGGCSEATLPWMLFLDSLARS